MDINALLSSITGQADQRTKSYADMAGVMSAETAKLTEMSTLNLQAADAVAAETARIAGAEAGVQALRDQAAVKASQIAGFNPQAAEDEYSRSIAEYNAAETERKKVRSEYDAAASQGFLDNPMGYILAQLQLPTLAARNNSLVDAKTAAADNIAVRKQMILDYKSGAAVDLVAQTKQINLDKAANAYSAAKVQLDAAQADQLSKMGQRKLQEFQLLDKGYDIQSDKFNKLMSVEQWKTQQALLAEQRAAVAEQRKVAAKDKAEKDAWELQMNTRLAAVSAARGMQVPMTIDGIKMLPKQQQDQWLNSAYNGTFGNNVLEAVAFLNPAMQSIQSSNPELARATQGISAGVQSYADSLKNDVIAGKIKSKDVPEEAAAKYTIDVQNAANLSGGGNSMLSARWEQVYNPLKVDHKSMLRRVDSGELAALKDNPLVAALKTVASVDPLGTRISVADEQAAIKSIVKQVQARTMDPRSAATAISDYYKVGSAYQRESTAYSLMGIAAPQRYLGVMMDSSFFGKPVEIDFLNPVSVEKGIGQLVRGAAAPSSFAAGPMFR